MWEHFSSPVGVSLIKGLLYVVPPQKGCVIFIEGKPVWGIFLLALSFSPELRWGFTITEMFQYPLTCCKMNSQS